MMSAMISSLGLSPSRAARPKRDISMGQDKKGNKEQWEMQTRRTILNGITVDAICGSALAELANRHRAKACL